MLEIILLHKENRHLVQDFLANAGSALTHFRYWSSRPIAVLDNHLATYIIQVNGKSIGYGHLDKEEDIVWLGIAIAEGYQSMGLGRLMMDTLVAAAKIMKLPFIQLCVDGDNDRAFRMYQKYGFETFATKASKPKQCAGVDCLRFMKLKLQK